MTRAPDGTRPGGARCAPAADPWAAASVFVETAGEAFGACIETRTVGDFVVRRSAYPSMLHMPRHHHGGAYLCIVLGGSMEEHTRSGRHTYEAGGVHFHPHGDSHATNVGPEGVECLSLEPAGPLATRMNAELATAPGGPFGTPVPFLGARLVDEFCSDDPASDLAFEASALGLVAWLLRDRLRIHRTGSNRWLGRVRDFLDENYLARVTLADLARIAQVDRSHLVRAFRARFGCTPGAYVRRLRLERARRTLLQTDTSIARIAVESGFASQAHFTKAFRTHAGLPPAAYRRLHRSLTR